MFVKIRPWVAFGIVLLGVLAAVGEVRAKHIGLNGKEDFKELSRRGFWETIHTNGTYLPTNDAVDATASAISPLPPGSSTYLNRQRNSYTWSSGWFNGGTGYKYYVGTVRDVGCFLINPDDPLCPQSDVNADGSPEPGADQRAEIWAYTPAGTGGATGSWTRVFQSPCIVSGGSFFISACQGFPNLGVAANLPRDIGYRGMTVSTNTVGDPADLPLDASPRLWVGAFGLGGRILHSTNGTAFSEASVNGLATIPSITSLTGLTALQNIPTVDLGYRSILIWRGRICIAPAGSYADEDLPVNPVVLCNSNPASTSSTWQTIVNVKTHPILGDPTNLGIFQMGVFNGDLYIGVSNRTTGIQVWRLPASECPIPTSSSTVCVADSPNWQRVITAGGGRPIPSDGLPDSVGASAMQVHNGGGGDALYIGTSDAAVFQNSRAEVFRINANNTWDLIVGSPRQKSVMDAMNADPDLAADFNCSTPNAIGGTKFDFDVNGPNPAVHACFPLSNKAAGFGDGATPTQCGNLGTVPFCSGPFGYVWRMAVHNDGSTDPSTAGNFLYLGMLHTGGGNSGGGQNNPSGYDLLKSKDGVTWNTAANTVVNDGMGNNNNYGVRTLVSVPGGTGGWPGGPALLVGSANPSTEEADEPNHINTGGAEVHLGTCTPTSTATAVASVVTQSRLTSPTYKNQVIFDATNNRYVAFDDDAVPNNSVDVTLVGSASNNTFCGDLTAYAWYPIDGLGGSVTGPALISAALTPPAAVPNLAQTLATGTDYTPYFYRLCVNGASAAPGCADVAVTASHNLPPTAAITPTPPMISAGSCGASSNSPRVCLVDMNGNLSETFTVQGVCSDPETLVPPGFPPASCVWSTDDAAITFAGGIGPIGSTGGSDDDPDSAGAAYTVTAPVGTGGSVYLRATDDHGYTNQARTRVRVIAPVHDVQVTSVAFSPALTGGYAVVGTPYTVNVTVRNNGAYDETNFNVTLADLTGNGTVTGPLNVASLDNCVDETTYAPLVVGLASCPTTVLGFTWTPTAASVHTLTATADTLLSGESSTTNNVATTTAQVGHSLTILGSPSSNANPVASGGTANLSVDAVDTDTTHVLAYSWAADCPPALVTDGTFGTSTAASTTWTAPENTTGSQQYCAISVNVNDGGGGLSQTPSYTQTVNPAHTLTIIGPTSTVNPVASSGTTALAVTANDSFGHTRFYSWQVMSCSGGIGTGSFNTPTNAGTNWTASPNLTGSAQTCTIRVTVNDGAVSDPKSTFGEVIQTVNALPHTLTINSGPSGSPDPVASTGTANLSVTATDSYGHPLSYSWSASCPVALGGNGTFNPLAGNVASLTWTAPANTTGSVQSCTISVNVNDGVGGLSTAAPGPNPSYSQEVSVACSSAICAPTGVTAAVLTTTPRVFKVSWTDIATNETSYQVQRCKLSFGFCSYSTVTGSPFAANTNTINNTVSSAGTYRYRVRACNASGCSAYVTSNNIAVQ